MSTVGFPFHALKSPRAGWKSRGSHSSIWGKIPQTLFPRRPISNYFEFSIGFTFPKERLDKKSNLSPIDRGRRDESLKEHRLYPTILLGPRGSQPLDQISYRKTVGQLWTTWGRFHSIIRRESRHPFHAIRKGLTWAINKRNSAVSSFQRLSSSYVPIWSWLCNNTPTWKDKARYCDVSTDWRRYNEERRAKFLDPRILGRRRRTCTKDSRPRPSNVGVLLKVY